MGMSNFRNTIRGGTKGLPRKGPSVHVYRILTRYRSRIRHGGGSHFFLRPVYRLYIYIARHYKCVRRNENLTRIESSETLLYASVIPNHE